VCCQNSKFFRLMKGLTASVAWWPEFLAANPEDLGSISGATKFSAKQWSGMGSTQPREDE
jgi:hypothetical protein